MYDAILGEAVHNLHHFYTEEHLPLRLPQASHPFDFWPTRCAILFLREGTEDALHLNIYSPSFVQGEDDTLGNIAQEGGGTVGNKTLLPVMVFFHGGGFVSGSGSRLLYGPELLLDKGVLLVFFFTFFYYKPRSTIWISKSCLHSNFCILKVVLVAPNFRVSVLGGLYIEGEAPGNQMLRDQVSIEN